MEALYRRTLVILIILGVSHCIWSQEIPRIHHFTKKTYGAYNQNWSIDQGNDCRIYFGNSKGLIQYDGNHWKTYLLPNRQIVRAVAVGSEGRIYTGGYASFGYWEADSLGRMLYFSINHQLKEETADEEIWNIIVLSDKVLFQSFSKIFLFENEQLKVLYPPSNIMFLEKIGEQIFIPTISHGLFELKGEDIVKVSGSEIFSNKKIAVILPFQKNSFLIGTQNGELYCYQQGVFVAVQNRLTKFLRNFQLNKGLRLRNGRYVFGSILNGLYITDADFRVIKNINKANGLQNNTILSLHENHEGNLWVGMDKGIDLIELNKNILFFNDGTGQLGTVYSAVEANSYLYVGTNQGVFYKKKEVEESSFDEGQFKLLEGSQGQVWQLKKVDQQVFCGHNSGTYVIDGERIKKISQMTGGWWLLPLPKHPEIMLQGTYTGIAVFSKLENREDWTFSHKITGFDLPLKKILFDHTGLLWGISPHNNLYSFSLSKDYKEIIEVKKWSIDDGLTSEYALDICKIENHVIIKSGDIFLEKSPTTHQLVPISSQAKMEHKEGKFKIISFKENGYFEVYPDHVVWYSNQSSQRFNLSLVPRFENIIDLDAYYLFCMDNGYALLNKRELGGQNESANLGAQSVISEIVINENQSVFPVNKKMEAPLELQPAQNQLKFICSVPCAMGNAELEYKLEGTQDKWTDFEPPFIKEFSFLPAKAYNFKIRNKLTQEVTAFPFSILPKWYQTKIAVLLYLLISLITLGWLYRLHRVRLERQRIKMEKEQQVQLKQQRIALENEKLQSELTMKTKELANSTMNLIKKNEFLLQMKENIQGFTRKNQADNWMTDAKRLATSIDRYLSNNEDWKVFEANFNQVHETFLRKLKNDHPDLTPGDLKLAAYLKMNLSSKEIAPLLNISIRGVENKRYRLRKKINLPSSSNLIEYLMRY